MKLTLLPNWKRVLNRATSIQLGIVAAILSGMEIALPLVQDIVHFPRGPFAILSFTVTVLAVLARLVAQPKMNEEPHGK